MGRFWDEATAQAGREFGARHWHWFAGARVARRVLPALSGVAIVVGVIWALRWVAAHWAGAWATIAGWAPAVGWWTVGVVAAGLAIILVTAVVVYLRRNWWRLTLRSSGSLVPIRFRRF